MMGRISQKMSKQEIEIGPNQWSHPSSNFGLGHTTAWKSTLQESLQIGVSRCRSHVRNV